MRLKYTFLKKFANFFTQEGVKNCMKKVIIDCALKTKPILAALLKIGFPNIEILGMTESGNLSDVPWIIDTVNRHPNEVTIVTTSVLTNLAAAINQDENHMEVLKEVLIIGGSRKIPGDYSPVAEQSFGLDPNAAQIVFKCDHLSKKIINLDLIELVELPKELKKLFLVLGFLSNENILKAQKAYVEIETEGVAKGQSICDIGGIFHEGTNNSEIFCDVDNEALFLNLFDKK